MSGTGLPPHLVELFVPRKPLEFLPPKKKRPQTEIGGVADLLNRFEIIPAPPSLPFDDFNQRRARRHREKHEKHQSELKAARALYDPLVDEKSIGNRLKTIFVGRLSYDTTESKLRREMEYFGVVNQLRIVRDENGSSRGYAFVEFDTPEFAQKAVGNTRPIKLDGRVILIDKECGRNIESWFPRRLGGGRGPQRLGRRVQDVRRAKPAFASSAPSGARGGRAPFNNSGGFAMNNNSGVNRQPIDGKGGRRKTDYYEGNKRSGYGEKDNFGIGRDNYNRDGGRSGRIDEDFRADASRSVQFKDDFRSSAHNNSSQNDFAAREDYSQRSRAVDSYQRDHYSTSRTQVASNRYDDLDVSSHHHSSISKNRDREYDNEHDRDYNYERAHKRDRDDDYYRHSSTGNERSREIRDSHRDRDREKEGRDGGRYYDDRERGYDSHRERERDYDYDRSRRRKDDQLTSRGGRDYSRERERERERDWDRDYR